MDISIKVRGVTRNWVLNVLLLLTAIILASVIIIIATVHSNYYDSVSSYINSIAGSFDRLAVCDNSAYYDEARSLSTQFSLKNQVEVQILDTAGTVIVSTSGYLPPEDEKMPDYEKAVADLLDPGIEAASLTSTCIGRWVLLPLHHLGSPWRH